MIEKQRKRNRHTDENSDADYFLIVISGSVIRLRQVRTCGLLQRYRKINGINISNQL